MTSLFKNQSITVTRAVSRKLVDTGEHMLRAGSSVLQPPGIKHREVRHSDDMELVEIIAPGDFDTHEETAP
ncbi:MAG: hypothetical protein WBC93_09755 [Sulfitobacter sp.]